jgi:general secretion pathway protein H
MPVIENLWRISPHPLPSPASGRAITHFALPLAPESPSPRALSRKRERGSDRRAGARQRYSIKAGGFSLIELVAVLVLIALVFAMVTLSFSKSLASAKIQAASRDLVAALRFTRGQAIVKGKSTSLELDVENNRYMTPGRRVVALPPNMRMTLLTADNEVTGANSGRIRFFPDGASTGGHISVFMGKDEWRINVDWLTGAVTREELKK